MLNIGDVSVDAVTRAMRTGILDFQTPVWTNETAKNLSKLGDMWSDEFCAAIRLGKLNFTRSPEWASAIESLDRVFNLNRKPHHLFRAKPAIPSLELHEPQITKVFAYFLNNPSSKRIERVRALLSALGSSSLSDSLDDASKVRITSEERIENQRRTDLLIKWQDSSIQQYAVVVEAKFGNTIKTGQLSAYRNHIVYKLGIKKSRRLLVVIGEQRSRQDRMELRRNSEWRWSTWLSLLISYERLLPVEYDDCDFVRFRRIIWNNLNPLGKNRKGDY